MVRRFGARTLLAVGALAAGFVVVSMPDPSAQSIPAEDGRFVDTPEGEVEAPGDPVLTYAPAAADPTRVRPLAARPPYTFFPQAGIHGQDLFITNYVDMTVGSSYDITQPGRDFECTAYSYQGHNGHDSGIDGFREQAIGVPVFAALDGTVTQQHDGEPDQNTTNDRDRPGNLVVLRHEGNYHTGYYHLKRDSVAVRVGDFVRAGTQLGLTGSSGNSSGPHLHFSSFYNGATFEPNSGECRRGDTYWTRQPRFRRDTYLTSFTFGTNAFEGRESYPWDEVTRLGTYAQGTATIYYRYLYRNLPATPTVRTIVLRPDGTIARDENRTLTNAALVRKGSHQWSWTLNLNTTGTWAVEIYVDSRRVASAPFTVVSSATAITNRAPLPIELLKLDPARPRPADVPMCLVTPGSLYRRDPDYDLVRYRYRWYVDNRLVREVTSAALSDSLPASSFSDGQQLRCEATPFDEGVAGPTVTVTNAATPANSIGRFQLTGCERSAAPLPGWRNCRGTVEATVNGLVPSGNLTAYFGFPDSVSVYQGTLAVPSDRAPGTVRIDVLNSYLPNCPALPYVMNVTVRDGRQADPSLPLVATAPITVTTPCS
jgi:murein DD-endopeptidase MepM/ murein hydrolase activator NlpD